MRENIEVKCDAIAGVLNQMLEDGRLVRRRKGKQKVLWSLAEDGNLKQMKSAEKPPETASQISEKTGSG